TQGQTELLLRDTELLLRATELLLGATETLIRDTELLLRATELLLRATELLLFTQTQNCYSGTQNCYSGTHNRLIKEYVRQHAEEWQRRQCFRSEQTWQQRKGSRQHYSQPEASAPGVIQRSCLHRQPCRRRLVGLGRLPLPRSPLTPTANGRWVRQTQPLVGMARDQAH
ncbi:unnamed protein product, partial [Staurois parvus]